jgi:hypothetical protein
MIRLRDIKFLPPVAVSCLACALASAQTASQSISLSTGWNAVWLEVEPTYEDGASVGLTQQIQDVFSDPAIEVVASPKPLSGFAELYAADPQSLSGTTSFNKDEWLQWKRSDPTGSNNLVIINGSRPYLVKVATGASPVSINLRGKARFFRPKWIPNRYNLFGFGLSGNPTFSQFFGPSGTKHPLSRIFTLSPDGNWVKVSASANMVEGRAYWIFASGPSEYVGPVAVDFGLAANGFIDYAGPTDAVAVGSEGLNLDLEEITLSNLSNSTMTPTLDLISSSGTGLELHVVTPATQGLSYVAGTRIDNVAGPGSPPSLGKSLSAKTTNTLTLGAQRSSGWADQNPRINLYRFTTGTPGAAFWLPVSASKSDVAIAASASGTAVDSPTSGLWVGEAVVDASTSIVVDGAPVQPSAGTAPLRLILHVAADGKVRLLSQVTIMQTKSASPEIKPTPVLVLDPARIPYFEGIQQRGGKRVGVRVESIAYDMPRSSSAWSGASLSSFATRPPELRESYDLSVNLTGNLNPGAELTGAWIIDPFHRSNPFRHAYHQSFPKGPQITRNIKITFSTDRPVADRLTAVFTETISGVIKSNLTARGKAQFQRVSPVTTLEGLQ